MRSLEDVKSWLSQSHTGSAETGAAPFWRLIERYRPETRLVLIRRPVDEVVESLLRLDMQGAATLHREMLNLALPRLDAKLDQVAARWKGPLLSVPFEALNRKETCRDLFEFCLPYKLDMAWWDRMDRINIQCSMPALMRYTKAFRPQMGKMAAIARHAMLADMASKDVAVPDDVTIQEERFDEWYSSAQGLIDDHLVQVGEGPGAQVGKNLDLMRKLDSLGNMQIMTAKSNGRPFGYLMTVLSPSLESPDTKMAVQTTFYASRDYRGLGIKLQRASLVALKKRGIDEVWYRAGPRGDGPKMGALYRRLGAQEDGQLYRLNLRN